MREISLTIERKDRYGADGVYQIHAPGYILAELFWADSDGNALPGWTPFAYIPLISGRGSFIYPNGRAVPDGASAVLCRAVSDDCGQSAECLQCLPAAAAEGKEPAGTGYCFVAASDLHISNKSAPFAQLYDFSIGSDGLLLAGDTVNDGTGQQFEFMKNCVLDNWKRIGIFLPIYTAAGNHDMPLKPLPSSGQEGGGGYPAFQDWLRKRAESAGFRWNQDACGAYAAPVGEDMEIIGLQCVSHFRRFVFRDGLQLQWLEKHLDETEHLKWHIILCHAPLLKHNPQRRQGKDAPYLSRDDRLQSILDSHHNIIFISGHTHFSLNNLSGCVEWEASRENLYLNVGSIRKTTMNVNEPLVPNAWTEGSAVRLNITDSEVEITTVSLYTGNKQARGYYCFRSRKNSGQTGI